MRDIYERYPAESSVDGEDLVVPTIHPPAIEEDQYEPLSFIERELGITFEGNDSLTAQEFINQFYFEAQQTELDRLELAYGN